MQVKGGGGGHHQSLGLENGEIGYSKARGWGSGNFIPCSLVANSQNSTQRFCSFISACTNWYTGYACEQPWERQFDAQLRNFWTECFQMLDQCWHECEQGEQPVVWTPQGLQQM